MSVGSLTLEHPLDIDDARLASRRLSEQRRTAEDDLQRAVEEAAEAERTYRQALAKAFVRCVEGTAAQREAEARAGVAAEAYERDLKAGMVRVLQERLRGLEGERSQLKTLMEWSAKINEELREQRGRDAVVS